MRETAAAPGREPAGPDGPARAWAAATAARGLYRAAWPGPPPGRHPRRRKRTAARLRAMRAATAMMGAAAAAGGLFPPALWLAAAVMLRWRLTGFMYLALAVILILDICVYGLLAAAFPRRGRRAADRVTRDRGCR